MLHQWQGHESKKNTCSFTPNLSIFSRSIRANLLDNLLLFCPYKHLKLEKSSYFWNSKFLLGSHTAQVWNIKDAASTCRETVCKKLLPRKVNTQCFLILVALHLELTDKLALLPVSPSVTQCGTAWVWFFTEGLKTLAINFISLLYWKSNIWCISQLHAFEILAYIQIAIYNHSFDLCNRINKLPCS